MKRWGCSTPGTEELRCSEVLGLVEGSLAAVARAEGGRNGSRLTLASKRIRFSCRPLPVGASLVPRRQGSPDLKPKRWFPCLLTLLSEPPNYSLP